MKREVYKYPKSSFLGLEKDMGVIIDLMLKNENLKRMLYYTSDDCLSKPHLSEEQTLELFGKNIKIIPRLEVENEVMNYIIISFDSFIPNESNPQFRNNYIEFDIICHYDNWHLKDYQLRPYKIAAEIDSMLNTQRLTGIGKLEFLGAAQVNFIDEFAGLCLIYEIIHGEEDKKGSPNPTDEENMIENFNNIFNA